jgi:DNA polymerase IV (DinB-like DNA polymerase)
MRIIMHIDLDSFYASVEETRQPGLKGKPVVVCMFSGRKGSGAVATANYKARKLGIRSGQPVRTARELATRDTVFLKADREFYRKVSDRIMSLLKKRADNFEQRSIDEAYLDVSGLGSYRKAEKMAREIKEEILSKENLTCSVGIGPNKLVAKMASREKKPDGLAAVRERDVRKFLSGKPVEKLPGIGPKTLKVLERFSVRTVRDLAGIGRKTLQREFGERKGLLLHKHALGIDNEPVEEAPRQQLSRLGTLEENTNNFSKITSKLTSLADDLFKKIKKEKLKFRTITLITVSTSLEMKTRSTTLPSTSGKKEDILEKAGILLESFLKENPHEILRRVGIRVSSLEHSETKKQKALTDF